MIILKKSVRKSVTPPFLKRPIPIPYFHRLSIIYQIPLRDRQIKFTPSSLRKQGGSELSGLKKNIRKKWVNFILENCWSTMLFLIETGEEEVAQRHQTSSKLPNSERCPSLSLLNHPSCPCPINCHSINVFFCFIFLILFFIFVYLISHCYCLLLTHKET